MAPKRDKDQRIAAAREADRLKNDPNLLAAFDSVDKGLIDALRNGQGMTADDLLRVHLSLKLLGKIRTALMSRLGGRVDDGKLAAAELKAILDVGRNYPE